LSAVKPRLKVKEIPRWRSDSIALGDENHSRIVKLCAAKCENL